MALIQWDHDDNNHDCRAKSKKILGHQLCRDNILLENEEAKTALGCEARIGAESCAMTVVQMLRVVRGRHGSSALDCDFKTREALCELFAHSCLCAGKFCTQLVCMIYALLLVCRGVLFVIVCTLLTIFAIYKEKIDFYMEITFNDYA